MDQIIFLAGSTHIAAGKKAFNEALSSIEEMFGKFSMFFFLQGVLNIVILAVTGLRRTVPLGITWPDYTLRFWKLPKRLLLA